MLLKELDINTISTLKSANSEFRNQFSHTSTYSEAQAGKIFIKYKEVLLTCMKELQFLETLTLLKINNFKKNNNKLIGLTEIYRGSIRILKEDYFEDTIGSDSNHILILDSANDGWLDLYPFYQFVINEETKDQQLMFLMKYFDKKEEVIKGECIPWPMELNLDGKEIFNL